MSVLYKGIYNREIITCYLLTFLSFGCYGFFLEPIMRKFVAMAIGLLILFTSFGTIASNKGDKYFKIIKYIIISVFVSFIFAYIFWGQDFILTFRVAYPCFYLMVFFYLYKKDYPTCMIEKYVILFGLLYSVIWIYAILFDMSLVMERLDDDFDDSRGMVRFRLDGGCMLYLAYFICLNKFRCEKKYKYLVLTVLFFAMMFFQLTRQLIVISLLVSLLYLFSHKIKLLLLLIGVSLILFNSIQNIDPNKITYAPLRSMVVLTIQQAEENESGEENIRITAYKYFFSDLSPNIFTSLFGNSFPHSESQYGRVEEKLKSQGLFLSDVGYAEIYVTLGFIGMVLYVLLFLTCSLAKMPSKFLYAKLYMIFMALYTVASNYYTMIDGHLTIAICVYIIMKYRINSVSNLKNNSKFVIR